jgi:predicted alpha/beta superfamily hydrolase
MSFRLIAAMALACCAQGCAHVETSSTSATDEKVVVFDVLSRATGANHRLFMSKPEGDPPDGGFPVIYLLDASWYFDLVVDIALILMRSGDMPRAVIVGIGYEDPVEARRLRIRDFTTPAPEELIPQRFFDWNAEPGGADAFLTFLNEEARPFVGAKANISPSCQLLIGHSLSGFFVLRAAFKGPNDFSGYAVGDPSVWWNRSEVLGDEASFLERMSRGGKKVRLVLGYSTDPQAAPQLQQLAARLSATDAPSLEFTGKASEGNTHNSMLPGFFVSAIKNGLRCES